MSSVRQQHGYADVLVGLQYGDEGKAKIIDLLAPGYDVIARFNGGANAGHTLDTPQGRIVLHQVPSGVFDPQIRLYIGSGCAVNVWKLAGELDQLAAAGVDVTARLTISDRAALIQPVHLIIDELNSEGISTTKNGIGPCYADRAYRMRDDVRMNLQLRDALAEPQGLVRIMQETGEAELVRAGDDTEQRRRDLHQLLSTFTDRVERIRDLVSGDRGWMSQQVASGARVLFEGAQSLMLDVVHGDQPYVTSSHTVPAYAYVGGDLSPRFHRYTIGVAKAVVSRVGNGPFPSELGADRSAEYFSAAVKNARGHAEEHAEYDARRLLTSQDPMELGIALRMLTHEYGSGTGRPRRIGILDLEQLGDAVRTFGVDVVYINKVDCLALFGDSYFGGVPVRVPGSADVQVRVLPSFRVEDLDPARPEQLPPSLAQFKALVEQELGVPVIGFGLGPERGQIAQFFELGEHATDPVTHR